MDYIEAFRELAHKLKAIYDDSEAENIADWVLEYLTGKKRWQRQLDNGVLETDTQEQLDKITSELLTHKPVQYVLNEAWFCRMRFKLNEDVLIPRPETEELVDMIISENKGKSITVLDIGTGSGCIPISLKKNLPHAVVTGIDISKKALDTARENAAINQAEVSFLQIDFLDETSRDKLTTFDVIVSNPPYIPAAERDTLDKNVVDFEPEVALFVADTDPLLFYRHICRFSRTHLKPEGKIYLECHESYAQEVKSLFEEAYTDVQLKKDIYGKKRMVVVQKLDF